MTIRIDNLSFRYDDVEALRGVSVEVRPGAITAVLGPNAAGKSTLLRCIIGALRPASGAVHVDDKPAHRMKTTDLAQRIAYVPQRSMVAAAFTVREVVELGRYAIGPNRKQVDDAIERLQLVDLQDRPYPALSVGQQQRVTLARALAQLQPNGHLILDEPMSAMDLAHARQGMRLLHELADEGVTVLIAMHDLSLAATVADEAWLLDDGRLVASGNVCHVLDVTRLESVFNVHFQWIGGGEAGGPWLVAGG